MSLLTGGAWPRRVCVVGLGLIGGSLALAIRRAHPEVRCVGVDRDPQTRARAQARGVVQRAHARWQEAVPGCDLVVLAVPVDAIVALLAALPSHLPPQALVTDVGSTKAHICARGRQALGERFIGGHPMTGAERSGLDAADPFLFENALYALTPTSPEPPRAGELAAFLETLGAQVVTLSPRAHDAIVAHVSHLPQLLATALCDLVADKAAEEPLYRELAAGGFRDLTRVAASPYALWEPILRDNRAMVEAALEALERRLEALRAELRTGSLAARFERAARFRRELPWRAKGLLKPLHRIAVVLQDRPGALVEALQVLAKAHINLKDLELRRVREGDGSTFYLYVESPATAEQGVRALRRGGWEAHRVD